MSILDHITLFAQNEQQSTAPLLRYYYMHAQLKAFTLKCGSMQLLHVQNQISNKLHTEAMYRHVAIELQFSWGL